MAPTVHLEESRALTQPLPCEHCQLIFRRPDTLQLLASETGLCHSREKSSILRTAIDGCRLCRWLLCMAKYKEIGGKKRIGDVDFNPYRSGNWPVQVWRDDLQKFAVQPPSDAIDRTLQFCWKGDLRRQRHVEVTRAQTAMLFEVTVEYGMLPFRALWRILRQVLNNTLLKGDKAMSIIPNTLPNGDVSCPRTYESIAGWLVNCDQNHIGCHRKSVDNTTASNLPSLVLDVFPFMVSGREMIRLHRVAGQELKYAALSYCWGTTQENATRASNVHRYMDHIDISSLPQTIQDSVYVTRKLGLRYLWVDSMCIVQDSDDDKAHEIARMESIYNHAYITISASSASNCKEGFLQKRTLPGCYMHLHFQVGASTMTEVALGPISFPGVKPYPLEAEPIHSRAWTFQESFMSRRVLIYGQDQLYWKCALEWGKEGGSITRTIYHTFMTGKDNFARLEASYHILQCPTAADWKSVVVLYSSKKLGDPEDKMPAISSIAAFFARKMVDTYIAGLWPKIFRELLCWRLLTSARPLIRSPCWRAPSWSFYSVDGPLCFENATNFEPIEEGLTHWAATVVSCGATPSLPHVPFGRISSATLVMRGRMVQVEPDGSPPLSYNFMVHSYGSSQIIGEIAMDTFVENVEDSFDPLDRHTMVETNYGNWTWSQPLWFLMLGMSHMKAQFEEVDAEKDWAPFGLALAKMPNGTFHRIGFAKCYPRGNGKEIFLEQEPEIITIV